MVAEAKSTVIVFLEKMDADVRQRLLEVTLSFARALQDQKPTGHLVVKRNFQVYLLDIWTRRRAKWRDGKPHALLKKYQRDARSFKELTNVVAKQRNPSPDLEHSPPNYKLQYVYHSRNQAKEKSWNTIIYKIIENNPNNLTLFIVHVQDAQSGILGRFQGLTNIKQIFNYIMYSIRFSSHPWLFAGFRNASCRLHEKFDFQIEWHV